MTENTEPDFGTAPSKKVVDDEDLLAYAVANDGTIVHAFPDFVAMGVGYAGSGEHSNPAMVLKGEWRIAKGDDLKRFQAFFEMPSADFVVEVVTNLMGALISQESVTLVRNLLVQLANAEGEQGIRSAVQAATQDNETQINEGINDLKKEQG